MTRHIGFLFNHEVLHQVSHMAPLIPSLAASALNTRISVMASSQRQLDHVRALVGDVPNCAFILLQTPRLYEALDRVLGKVAPFKRVATLKANLAIFETLDALVVPEVTSLMLRNRYGLSHLQFISVSHGAGDRDVTWTQSMAEFDFVLLPGRKHRDRMLALGLVRPENHAVTGYMKFDTLRSSPRPKLRFRHDRPIVLYNPHFDPYLSSWYRMGEQVLDYFAASPDYNLIFAPHLMLMQRRLHTSLGRKRVRWRRDIAARFQNADNILIDTGSPALADMTYTRAADIYLGDVSSQVYEFVAEPRPCIFLNAHGARWRDDPEYRFWAMGPVVDSIEGLDRALRNHRQDHVFYLHEQQKLFGDTIDLGTRPAADRAADAITHFLGLEACLPQHIQKSA